jgi:hypothetical protein
MRAQLLLRVVCALVASDVTGLNVLEPADGLCLHLAGQSPAEFGGYSKFLAPQNTRPLGYTTYHKLADLNHSGAGAIYFDRQRATLDELGDPSSHAVLPHISLDLTCGLERINAGQFDLAIRELAQGLPRAGRPVFLRIGYEFNGGWNNYTAAAYVRAWRRIAAAISLNATQRARTALVWDMTCDETGQRQTDWDAWWPGADVVDWWGVNVFQNGTKHGVPFSSLPNSQCVLGLVAAAAKQGYPVLIAEAMPRYLGTDHAGSWAQWFAPLFDTLLTQPAVKGWSYIDRDCTADAAAHKNCAGGQWGDARIESAPGNASTGVGVRYAAALRGAGFVHAAPLGVTCRALGVAC